MMAILQAGLLAQALLTTPVAATNNDSEFVTLERLSDRVTLAYWVGTDRRCNLTAIRTQKGLVLIDSEMSPRVMAPIKTKLEQAFGRSDWAYIINTHAHDNHAGGNSLFKKATIVGHENLAEDMRWLIRRQNEPEWRNRDLEQAGKLMKQLRASLPQAAQRSAAEARMIRGEIRFWELHTQDQREGYPVIRPSLTFSNEHKLDLGDVRLELVFFGKSHSLSDILIYVPEERLLVTGGICYQRAQFPEIGEQTRLDDLRRFFAVLNRFLAEEVKIDRVIPSHSLLLVKADLAPVRDYYTKMFVGLRAAHDQGQTFEQVQLRFPASRFPGFRDPPPGFWSYGMHRRNVRNLWRILEEEGSKLTPAETRPTAATRAKGQE